MARNWQSQQPREDENTTLMKLLAEQMLDLAEVKELVSKKW